jgi:hypothetical protein
MNAHLHLPQRTSPLLLAAAVVVLLLSALAIGSIMGVVPGGVQHRNSLEPVVPPASSAARVQTTSCASCGTVIAIRTFELRDSVTPVNAAAGSAPGAMSVIPGLSSDSNRARHVYRVTIHMEDGSYRTVSHGATPGFAVGDKVRLIQGALVGQKG